MAELVVVGFVYYLNRILGFKNCVVRQLAGDFQVDIAQVKNGQNIFAGESGRGNLLLFVNRELFRSNFVLKKDAVGIDISDIVFFWQLDVTCKPFSFACQIYCTGDNSYIGLDGWAVFVSTHVNSAADYAGPAVQIRFVRFGYIICVTSVDAR